MARLWSCGFELNSVSDNVEFGVKAGSPTISTSTVRSGSYAYRARGVNGDANSFRFSNTGVSVVYIRGYIRIATIPDGSDAIFAARSNTDGNTSIAVYLNTNGTLFVQDVLNAVQLGNSSSALSLNTWHRVELKIDVSIPSTTTIEGRINGTTFATGTTNLAGAITVTDGIQWGVDFIDGPLMTVGDVFFDDIAVNDNTGSFQNSWPGAGSIIHLQPNAAGDVNTIAGQVGGTAGAANNFTRVSEVTPDDASTFNSSNILNQEDLLNCTNSGLGALTTINLVSVGGRFTNNIADAGTAIKFEIEKTSGGTKTQSAAIIPNTTTWSTNSVSAPHSYPLTLYQDPDGAAWTSSTLDSMQIGYIISTGGSNGIRTSTVWALVDYTEAHIAEDSTDPSQMGWARGVRIV